MSFLFWLILSFSILSLMYYCVITVYAGLGTAFSWFWLVAGIVGVFICFVIKYMTLHEIKLVYGLRMLITIIAISIICIFAIIEGVLIYHANRISLPGMDYIIILGAQVKGTRISKTLLKRLTTAENYMKENPKTLAIVSGGKGKNEALSEAEAMKQYLIKKGIDRKRIIKEDKSRNTYENILFSKPFLKSDSTVAIVTNGFHIFRSLRIAKKQGLTYAQGLGAPTDKLLSINYYLREAAGVIKGKILGKL